MGLVAPQYVGSSRTRAQTHVPCIGRQILNHCATREALDGSFGRRVMCREGRSVSRVSVYANKNKMTDAVQCDQPATRELTDHPGEWCHIEGSVLDSAAGRLSAQQWM